MFKTNVAFAIPSVLRMMSPSQTNGGEGMAIANEQTADIMVGMARTHVALVKSVTDHAPLELPPAAAKYAT